MQNECKQSWLGFKFGSPIPFSELVTIISRQLPLFMYLLFYFLPVFHTSPNLRFFHWSLGLQVSWTLLIMLDDLNSAVVLLISILTDLLFCQSFFSPFGDRSKDINYKWYHSYLLVPQPFQLPDKIQFFFYFQWSTGTTKFIWCHVLFFLLINTRSDLLTGIRRSVCISKSLGISCILFSRQILVCACMATF